MHMGSSQYTYYVVHVTCLLHYTQQHLHLQVQDLAVASPATVSRCGMVYVAPSELGWRPFVTSWVGVICICDMCM